MPTYITQGRYTREAIKGMIVKPEDRFEALSRHVARAGGRVIGYYLTFGEYDFLTIIEAPGETQMAAILLSAAGAGGITDRPHHDGDQLRRSQGRVRGRGRSVPFLPHAGRRVNAGSETFRRREQARRGMLNRRTVPARWNRRRVPGVRLSEMRSKITTREWIMQNLVRQGRLGFVAMSAAFSAPAPSLRTIRPSR